MLELFLFIVLGWTAFVIVMRHPGVLLLLLVGGLLFLLAGCASLPTQTVNGIPVYVRSADEVARYCYSRLTAEERAQPHIYGCFTRGAGALVMVEAGHPEVLAHELRHAAGWDHRGPCHSSKAFPDGLKPDGTPCEWYRP